MKESEAACPDKETRERGEDAKVIDRLWECGGRR